MMRVLLINPAMNLKKLGRFAGLLEPMPCIGLAYIAGALEEHGCLVHVVDMFAEKLSGDQIVQRARDFKPTLVGMTVLTPSEPVCTQLTNMIRAEIPNVKVIWGAVHADVFAKEIVRDCKADFVVHHDGEETICGCGR